MDWHARALALLEATGERIDQLDAALRARHLFAWNAVTLSPAPQVPQTPPPRPSAPRPDLPGGALVTNPHPLPVMPPSGVREALEIGF
jgi:hypothetical protein